MSGDAMGLERNDPNIHPADKPDKPGEPQKRPPDRQDGGVKVKEDNPGSVNQYSRLDSKKYPELNAEQRKERDDKSPNQPSRDQGPQKQETRDRTNGGPADSQRRGPKPQDNPGSPDQRSRMESKGLSPNGTEPTSAITEGVQQGKATRDQKASRPEEKTPEASDGKPRDPRDQQPKPEPRTSNGTETNESKDPPATRTPEGNRDQPSTGTGDNTEQGADVSRNGDGRWATDNGTGQGTREAEPNTAKGDAPVPSDQTRTGEPPGAKSPTDPSTEQGNQGEASTEGTEPVPPGTETTDPSSGHVDPAKVKGPEEPTEATEPIKPSPEQNADGEPATPKAEGTETAETAPKPEDKSTDPDEDPSAPKPEQPKPEEAVEPAEATEDQEQPERPQQALPLSVIDQLPDSIVGTRSAGGELIRRGEVFRVSPGDPIPRITRDTSLDLTPRPPENTREGTRHVEYEPELSDNPEKFDIGEPDPDTTNRRRRLWHRLSKEAGNITDASKKGGNELGRAARPDPNKDVVPGTARDTTSMPDTDYKPLKIGDGLNGGLGGLLIAAYVITAISRRLKRRSGRDNAGQ
jgi:hypothetical protein